MEKILRDPRLPHFFEKVDQDLAEKSRSEGCLKCGNPVHRSDYDRKPRGGFFWDRRYSFCCCKEGCRRRLTPPSVRFLGRKVYAGVVVVLMSTMMHGLKATRMEQLRRSLGLDPRTLKRWRAWWFSEFALGDFWKSRRGLFLPPVDKDSLPLSLLHVFGCSLEGVLKLLFFLSPITTQSWKGVIAF